MRGTQAEGVAATVKHFVLNSQETNRNTQASEVDERTLHEVYYPPFAAAVEAGVASVMGPYSDRNLNPSPNPNPSPTPTPTPNPNPNPRCRC